MTEILDAPDRLVERGVAATGRFRRPPREINLLDIAGRGLGLWPRGVRDFRLKEWQHIAVVTRTHFLALAVANPKVLGVSWVYAFERSSGKLVEHSRKASPGRAIVSRDLWNGECAFARDGYRVAIHNRLAEKKHEVDLDVSSRGAERIAARFSIAHDMDLVPPLVVSLPLGGPRVMYSVKAPCPVTGDISVGDQRVVLDPRTDFALLDAHHAYYPFRTRWKWATFAGRDASGKLLGANLTHNVIEDDDVHNENCIWHGATMSALSAARFDVPSDILQPWRIRTSDGRADLTFTPEGLRSETVDLKLFVSWYQAPFGTFAGKLTGEDGCVHEVRNLYGICEHHRVTW
jgi:hypothetical protein